MKIFTEDHNIAQYGSPGFDMYFGSLKPCVFDIETSGLSAADSKIVLTALLIPCENGLRVTQFLAEDPFEEDRVLAATMEYIKNEHIDYLITYNGDSFDIPFTARRLEALHLPYSMDKYDLDIYKFIRRNTMLPDVLDSLSQKNIERYLCIGGDRMDTITGRESVRLFQEYAASGSGAIEKIILTHNREDVLQLAKILDLLGQDDFCSVLKSPDFHEAIARVGFPAARADLAARPRISRSCLRIAGRQLRSPFSAVCFPDTNCNIRAEFDRKTAAFSIEVPLTGRSGSLYVDTGSLGLDDTVLAGLDGLDGYVDGYMILQEDKQKKHREINTLSMLLTDDLYDHFCDISK